MTSMKIAFVVQNAVAGAYEQNLQSTLKFITDAKKQGAQMVVFPEMNLTGYLTGPEIKTICRGIDPGIIDLFSTLAHHQQILILTGLAEKSDNAIYASHLVFHPDRQYTVYRKIHTAPFEKKYFTPGDQQVLFDCNGFRFGVQLCYDAHFPELSLAMALQNVDIIVMPHASPRGTPQEKCQSWMRHLTARAFDNGVYIAACNQTGDNLAGLNFPGLCLVIGPDGNAVYQSTDPAEGIHMVQFETAVLEHVRSHEMRYFLPHRRTDLF